VLNPHPTLIPAIEAGFVDSVYCFGSELGMERYVSSRADIFPVAPTAICGPTAHSPQVAGQYACDLFIGGTLQIDALGNSSTATKGRITGFGGAPNMGADPRGRRHDSPSWLLAGREAGETLRGRKLGGADGADPAAEWCTELRRTARRVRARSLGRFCATSGDDLWRRRHPCSSPNAAWPTFCAAGRRCSAKPHCAPSPAILSSAGDSRPKQATACAATAS